LRAFILTIDIEPDERIPAPGGRPEWSGLALTIERLTALRRRHPGARFSWFVRVDPQIETLYGDPAWALRRYRAELAALEAEGDAIGLHVHPFRWEGGGWISDYGDPAWVRHCIRVAVEGYAGARGKRATLFRFGDRWMSNDAMGELERHGIKVDLSLEPGSRRAAGMVAAERSSGELPDLRCVPRSPYRPSRRNYKRPPFFGPPRNVWELPITTGAIYKAWRAEPIPLNLGLRPDWIGRILENGADMMVSVARSGDLANPQALAAFEENLAQLERRLPLDHLLHVPQEVLGNECVGAGDHAADHHQHVLVSGPVLAQHFRVRIGQHLVQHVDGEHEVVEEADAGNDVRHEVEGEDVVRDAAAEEDLVLAADAGVVGQAP
jgi:hypothetical protein